MDLSFDPSQVETQKVLPTRKLSKKEKKPKFTQYQLYKIEKQWKALQKPAVKESKPFRETMKTLGVLVTLIHGSFITLKDDYQVYLNTNVDLPTQTIIDSMWMPNSELYNSTGKVMNEMLEMFDYS